MAARGLNAPRFQVCGTTATALRNAAPQHVVQWASTVFVFHQGAMSEHDTYTLRATTSGWDLRLNGDRLSVFETFVEAERTALSAAEASRRQSKGVSAYVQTASGKIDLLPKPRPGPAEDGALRKQVQSLLASPALGRADLQSSANP